MPKDIFDMKEQRDVADTTVALFTDLDGNEVAYTVDRVARRINNIMSGHDAACGMDDCETVAVPNPFTGEMVQVARCYVEGPTSPAQHSKKADAKDAPPPPTPRRVGFDSTRVRRDDTARGA